jgi:hypothetical protein
MSMDLLCQLIFIRHYCIFVHPRNLRDNQWRKLGGANVALATPNLKCGGVKICICTTRKLLKFVYL